MLFKPLGKRNAKRFGQGPASPLPASGSLICSRIVHVSKKIFVLPTKKIRKGTEGCRAFGIERSQKMSSVFEAVCWSSWETGTLASNFSVLFTPLGKKKRWGGRKIEGVWRLSGRKRAPASYTKTCSKAPQRWEDWGEEGIRGDFKKRGGSASPGHIAGHPFCLTLFLDILCCLLGAFSWHAFLTLLLGTLAGHSSCTLLLDTLVRTLLLDTLSTFLLDTLVWHSLLDTLDRTLLLDTLAGHSCLTLLRDTLDRTLFAWHSFLTLLLGTLAGHSSCTLLLDTLFRTLLLDTLSTFLLDTLAGHSLLDTLDRTLLLDTLAGHSWWTRWD